ncbi:hypothetical protein FYK19_01785 [Escherichia albertii]|nr:hypothetical protein FYK19_01785 [Escherichia albertii]
MMIFSIRFNQLVMVVGDGINTRLIECFTPLIGTISNSSQVYLSRLNPRILWFIARFLSSIINLNQVPVGNILCSV